jgi:hypothetical protein
MRRHLASGLLLTSSALVVVMAVLSGLGGFVAIVVLAATGDITVGAAVGLFFIGLPVLEGVVYLVTMAGAMTLMGIAKLLDRDVVSEWADSQPVNDY